MKTEVFGHAQVRWEYVWDRGMIFDPYGLTACSVCSAATVVVHSKE